MTKTYCIEQTASDVSHSSQHLLAPTNLCHMRAMLMHEAHSLSVQCVPSEMREQNRWARAFPPDHGTMTEQLAVRKAVSSVEAS